MVADEINHMLGNVPNSKMITENLSKKGLILVSKDLNEAVEFINQFAPEHLEIMTKKPLSIAEKITSVGLILTGPYTPVAASDYCFGTNHVLPTEGFSKVYSGLSVLDFVKRFNIVECSREGLRKIKEASIKIAESEGLFNHALAVKGRFKDE
jgi:histidinol dehydrogenase